MSELSRRGVEKAKDLRLSISCGQTHWTILFDVVANRGTTALFWRHCSLLWIPVSLDWHQPTAEHTGTSSRLPASHENTSPRGVDWAQEPIGILTMNLIVEIWKGQQFYWRTIPNHFHSTPRKFRNMLLPLGGLRILRSRKTSAQTYWSRYFSVIL